MSQEKDATDETSHNPTNYASHTAKGDNPPNISNLIFH